MYQQLSSARSGLSCFDGGEGWAGQQVGIITGNATLATACPHGAIILTVTRLSIADWSMYAAMNVTVATTAAGYSSAGNILARDLFASAARFRVTSSSLNLIIRAGYNIKQHIQAGPNGEHPNNDPPPRPTPSLTTASVRRLASPVTLPPLESSDSRWVCWKCGVLALLDDAGLCRYCWNESVLTFSEVAARALMGERVIIRPRWRIG